MEEAELTIDEASADSIPFPKPPLAFNFDVAEMGREECFRRVLEEVEMRIDSHGHCATEKGNEDEEMSLVDIMGGLELETGGESEETTFADILQRAGSMSEIFLEGVVKTQKQLLC